MTGLGGAPASLQMLADVLAEARADIHAAVACIDQDWRRREYARSARGYAVTVLVAAEATAEQRERARYYLAGGGGAGEALKARWRRSVFRGRPECVAA